MSTLTPTGGGRRSPMPAIVAVIVALAVGIAGGWWFAGRDSGGTGASPGPTNSCSSHSSVSGSAKPVVLPNPRTITVNVYNATGRKGLARSTSVEMASRGFVVGKVANDPLKRPVVGTAEVRYGRKGVLQAKVVAAQVPAAVLVRDGRADISVDLVIGDGFTAMATAVEAQTALTAQPTPTSSSGC